MYCRKSIYLNLTNLIYFHLKIFFKDFWYYLNNNLQAKPSICISICYTYLNAFFNSHICRWSNIAISTCATYPTCHCRQTYYWIWALSWWKSHLCKNIIISTATRRKIASNICKGLKENIFRKKGFFWLFGDKWQNWPQRPQYPE